MIDRRIDRLNRFRFALAEWLASHDTRALEFALGGVTIINGLMALHETDDGKPVAPYLESALELVTHHPAWWATALIGLGIAILLALCIGTRREHDTRPRALAVLVCAGFYIAVTVAVSTGAQPWVVTARYAFTMAIALFCSVVLLVEAMIEKKARP